ncbi:uncharacterized protein LOC111360287 [Spodoptera litura]|uniref:Uncharacterized protein LOC111360287 n=1 Tax=Spodoptera litura TaxID=69820 RepID=A0A9J7EPV8_SPOLT|nr:uncharacterized protein LOC111360287 [Spodoptera litura]
MSTKVTSFALKHTIDTPTRTCKGSNHKSERTHRHVPKKIITSKKPIICAESKSCSSCVSSKCAAKPKKTTKSDPTVTKKFQHNVVDYCKKCGDGKSNNGSKEKIMSILSAANVKCVRNDNSVRKTTRKPSKPVQQYYKNENFHRYEESVHDTSNNTKKNASLETIREVSEMHATISEDSILRVFSDSDEDVTYIDTNNEETIKKLKEFRQKNYFECHSAQSRIKSKVSATSLKEHKCVYRFYLNERLFPVPLNTDYNNKVRCVECQLPMDVKQELTGDKINGTIQAKVKLGSGDAQDMLLLLPVKDSLIIEERRKEIKQNNEYVYFGVVKLSANGNSIFRRNLPVNSLALKYQKGYQEYQESRNFTYQEIKSDDIIII